MIKIHPKQILFLDIETTSKKALFSELSAKEQALWEQKSQYRRKEDVSAEAFYNQAGIWAEFGKIICISVGYFSQYTPSKKHFRITSFQGEETDILTQFKTLLNTHFNRPNQFLCAHNGKEFDFPYIARRMLINGISLPEKLQLARKKPWEIPHLDTMELWRFGDYKHYTSLDLLTYILGIDSPKEHIDGSQIHQLYYHEQQMDKIVDYCQKDVLAVAQVFLKLQGEKTLTSEQVHWV